MPIVEMIVMAKSRKLGGKCIAGLRTDGKGWIRPVAPSSEGTLFQKHYTLTGGSEAEVLDVVEIEVKAARPEIYQPENWVISNKPWRLVARPASTEHQSILLSHIYSGPNLFGNRLDSIHVMKFEQSPVEASLALVSPGEVEWNIGTNIKGNRQAKAVFKLKSTEYELVVTDPNFVELFHNLPEGRYPLRSLKSIGLKPDDKFLLIISLGEPFQRYCYKLVASVLKKNKREPHRFCLPTVQCR